jgi:CheY-like chemotaxis protein
VRALIVDDEPTVRLLLSRILRRDVDCEVTEATNGIEALDLLASQRYDFVVLDVMMPIMDGIETLETIRRTPDLRNLPVMVLSAVRDEAQVRKLVALGVSAYLTKPVRPTDASTRIQRFVATVGAAPRLAQSGSGRTLRGLPDGARVLVVDGDADFRHFVSSALGHRYAVVEAAGGAQGLRACLQSRPDVIVLGHRLGVVPPPMFLRKLRSVPGLAAIPVVAATRGSDDPLADADAVIQRTFVPETFTRQFAGLITGGSAAQEAVLRPELRQHMISGTEQVFGMMLGIEVVVEAGEPPPPAAGADLARVLLSMPRADEDLEFGIAAGRDMSERMTALLLQGGEVVADEDVSSTLQEVANIISGRLQNALKAGDEDVSIGLPVVTSLSEELPMADTWAGVGFRNATGDIRFTTFLRPVARVTSAAAVTAVTSHA